MRRPMVAMILAGLLSIGSQAAASSAQSTHSPSAPHPHVYPFPKSNTRIADASRALANLWRPYDVTEIPGQQVLAGIRQVPLVNSSGGAISNAQAQALDLSVIRADVLWAWAQQNVQPSLIAHLFAEPFVIGSLGVALAKGTAIHVPPCGIYPTEIVVLAPSTQLRTELDARAEVVQPGDVPVREDYAGPCADTGTTRSGLVSTIQVIPMNSVVVEGSLRHDPVLGAVFFSDASVTCPGDSVIALRMCGQ
jgi:hypothetical protein